MAQTTYNDNVLIDGSQDIQQLRVQGHTTQNQPLQTWETSAGVVQSQITGDGRVIAGDDLGVSTPDALLEAHRAEASTTRPRRGIHSLGQISGTLNSLLQWMVAELEVRGATAMDALHTGFRVRASNLNTGTPTANAELRGADVEVIQDATAASAALPRATGLQVGVTNAVGKTITNAAALRLKLNNAGTITNPYSIYAEGPGVAHFEDYLEVKRPAAVPGTPATDFMRLYPKLDGKLYAKNWSGTEVELGAGGGGGGAMALIAGQTLSSPTTVININNIPQTFRHLMLLLEMRSDRAAINDSLLIRFNGDNLPANNYYRFNYQLSGSPPVINSSNYLNGSGNALTLNHWSILGASAAAGLRSAIVLHIFDYAPLNTSDIRQRQVTYYGYTPTGSVTQGGGYWANTTDRITAISIAPGNGVNLVAPSTYALYGLQ